MSYCMKSLFTSLFGIEFHLLVYAETVSNKAIFCKVSTLFWLVLLARLEYENERGGWGVKPYAFFVLGLVFC